MKMPTINLNFNKKRWALCGTRGVPGAYGGFETFCDQFCKKNYESNRPLDLLVFCDKTIEKGVAFDYADRFFMPISANGIQGIFYDSLCILYSILVRRDILLLGCSGAFFIPLARIFGIRVITNIAGLEWSRSKWGFFAQKALKFFEAMAVKFSNVIIADNLYINKYINKTYGIDPITIAYGGDQVLDYKNTPVKVPYDEYYFSMARCQPDNNIEMILDSFIDSNHNLVFVSNWSSDSFGEFILEKYEGYANIFLLNAIYDISKTNYLRSNSIAYIHGHSAGGTNPVLVESMFLECPCICFDNEFNNATTFDEAFYFRNTKQLKAILLTLKESELLNSACILKKLAFENYMWDSICNSYLEVLNEI